MEETEQPAAEEEVREITPAKRLEVMESDKFDDCMVESQTEITYLLRELVDKALFTLYFNHNRDFLLTSILEVPEDEDYFFLDFGGDKEMNEKALASDKIFCTTQHNHVKIQFILRGLQRTTFNGRSAFLARLPDNLLRLQRRQYYRLELPVTKPLICQIPITAKSGRHEVIEVSVIDISVGGMDVELPIEDRHFEKGKVFNDCTIELPDVGTVNVSFRVCNLYEIEKANGARAKHSGCIFVNLRGNLHNLIQRYILKADHEMRAYESEV